MSIEAMDYFINDFSTELIELYRCIEKTDSEFFRYAEMMDESWDRAGLFLGQILNLLKHIFVIGTV